MAINSEVKTVFTVDLAPFVDGLKTMLSMTETTGAQLNQLLTVNAKPPDYSGLEAQLKGLVDRTKEYVGANQSSITSNQNAIPVEQTLTNETGKAEKAIFKKADTLRGMRREAVMGMGALSFLMMSMQQMGGAADDATKKVGGLEKGLKAGVVAGFEVAMMLLMVNPDLDVLAIAIGLAATVGMTLYNVLNDTTDAIDRQKVALDKLSIAMKGMSISELQAARENEKQALQAIQNELDKLDEKRSVLGILDTENAERYQSYEQEFDLHTKAIDAINKELTSKVKSDAEARAFAVKAEIDAIADSRKKELADATLTYNKEQDEWKGHHDALVASTEKYNALIAQINKKYDDQEKAQAAKDQKESDAEDQKAEKAAEQLANAKQSASDSWFERDLNTMRIQGIQKGLTQEEIDNQALAAQRQRLQDKLNALNAIIDVNDAGQIKEQADLANKISAIDAKMAADKAENVNKVKAIEQQLVDYVANLEKKRTEDKEKATAARLKLVEQEIQAGRDEYNAADSFGTNMNRVVDDTIRNYIAAQIAGAVAAQLASVIETIPFPFNILAAPVAGLAIQAMMEAAIPKFAQGTPPEGFIVPPGYDKDNFMIGVSSGEKVNVQSAMRNTYLPTINKQTMAAPAALRQQQTGISNQSGGASGGGVGSNHVHLNISVNNLIGTDEYVRSNLKPAVEKLMRELGASSIDEVFINKWKNV
ncbi:MAG: hypothetical protein ABSA44_09590 [Bacteroidota bacterium]|jgi:hypothetical protein